MSPGCLLYQPEARIPNLKAQNVLHNCNKGIRTIQTLYGNIYLHCSPPPHLAPGSKSPPFEDTLGHPEQQFILLDVLCPAHRSARNNKKYPC